MKLEYLTSINGAVLVVYYVSNLGYQYEIAFWDGCIFQPQEMYESADKALNMGLETVKVVIGYQ
jgi:hypothetical protein